MNKRLISAALVFLMVFSGCGRKTQPEDLYTHKSTEDMATHDTAALTENDSSNSQADEMVSKSAVSTDKDKSKSTSSAAKASSKATSKKAASSKAAASSAASTAPKYIETIQYDYEIGGDDDPIREIEPEKVQQFILDEEAIVTEPKPENPTFENKYEDVAEDVMVDGSWFDDCVFLGDSLTAQLSYYNDVNGVFGDAKFVCSTSLSYWNSQWDIDRDGNVHPMYNGEKILLEDAVNITGAKKAIITLGMNDVGYWGPAVAVDYARSLVDKIKAKSPGTIIYLETVTPMMYGKEKLHLNNAIIKEFNGYLQNLASEECCGFLNSYDALVNDAGYLPDEFCSDPDALGLHLKFNGCAVWESFLKANVANVHPSGPVKGPEKTNESDSETESQPKSEPENDVVSESTDDTDNNSSETEAESIPVSDEADSQ